MDPEKSEAKDSKSAPSLSPEARRRRLVEFDVRYAIARSQREPLVILYEDLHWFDGASLAEPGHQRTLQAEFSGTDAGGCRRAWP